MSSTPNKPTFRGKAARVIMAGTLAVAFAPALPALADDASATDTATQVTSWKDFYASLGIDTTSGYDAVTSATEFTSHHAADIPTITHRVTNAEGATTSLDGFDATATSAEKTQQVQLKSAVYNSIPASHYTREFAITPDDTVEGYNWNDYKNSVYAVTVSDGTTTTGAVPWIDYYGEDTTNTNSPHYNKLEVALENGTSIDSNQQNVTRFAKFFDGNGNLNAGTYTITVYAKGYQDLTATVTVLATPTGINVTDASKAENALAVSGLPSDMADAKATVSYTVGSGRNAQTTYLAGSADGGVAINSDGKISLDATALAAIDDGANLTVRIDSSNYEPVALESTVAATADLSPEAADVTWKSFYAGLGIDTSTGYDAVTSATNFTSHHAADIPTITHRVTNAFSSTTALDGFSTPSTGTQAVRLQTAVFNDGPSSHYSREFAIYPDDTVEGYNWTDYKNSVYAVTVSDGTTTAGAVPWIDYYGESATQGFHYNKLEVALENGTSIDSNAQNVTRFAKFFDASGNLKTGTYTVTVYASGYQNLIAQVKVNPKFTGTATATNASRAANALAISGLPSDIEDAKVTVYNTEGTGRTAVTTYLAGDRTRNGIYNGASINSDGTVSLDAEELAKLADDAALTVRVESSNYQPIELSSKVADTATFPNTLKVSAKTRTVKAKALKKKKQTVAPLSASGQGTLSYRKTGGSKKLTVNAKNGKVTVKKGTKKGTYKAKVRVTAAGNANFASATKTVTATVKVK